MGLRISLLGMSNGSVNYGFPVVARLKLLACCNGHDESYATDGKPLKTQWG